MSAAILLSIATGTALASGGAPDRGAAPVPATVAPQAPTVFDAVYPSDDKTQPIPPSARYGLSVRAIAEPTLLPALDNAALRAAADARQAQSSSLLVETGIVRALNLPADAPAMVALPTPDGGELRIGEVGSAGALGLRVHLSLLDLPAGAELWIIDPATPTFAQVLYGAGPYSDGDVWSIIFRSDRVRLEYYVPPGVVDTGFFVIDELNHFYRDPAAPPVVEPASPTRDGPCQVDVRCYPQWYPLADATARIDYTFNGISGLCSGTLFATTTGDLTPYFMTASHCISTISAARSVGLTWFWQSTMCNGPAVSFGSLPRTFYTELVANSPYISSGGNDHSLLMIRGEIPAGLTWAGWDTAPVPNGTPVTGIHHPVGAYKKTSFGTRQPHAFGVPGLYLGVVWDTGTIEGGSSGSGLYRNDNQLYVGVASHSEEPIGCTNADGPSGYGRFEVFYNQVSDLLVEGADDAFAGNQSCATAVTLADPNNDFTGLVLKATASEDWFKLHVGPCGVVDIRAEFTDEFGDIDIELYDACGGMLLAAARSATDNETLTYAHPSGTTADYLLRVLLDSNVRNTYDLHARLLVPGPVITQQPQGDAVCAGASATLTVAASSAVASYQWRRDGVELVSDGQKILGAESATLTINDFGSADVGSYDCVLTNDCQANSTSSAAALTLLPGLTITQQPQSQTVDPNAVVFLSVGVDSPVFALYQWLRNDVPLTDGARIFGSQANQLVIVGVTAADAGQYRCEVTSNINGCVTTSSSATLSVVGACPGDLTGDGQSDLADLGAMFGCWNQPCGDLTGDGTTNLADLGILFADWNCGT